MLHIIWPGQTTKAVKSQISHWQQQPYEHVRHRNENIHCELTVRRNKTSSCSEPPPSAGSAIFQVRKTRWVFEWARAKDEGSSQESEWYADAAGLDKPAKAGLISPYHTHTIHQGRNYSSLASDGHRNSRRESVCSAAADAGAIDLPQRCDDCGWETNSDWLLLSVLAHKSARRARAATLTYRAETNCCWE